MPGDATEFVPDVVQRLEIFVVGQFPTGRIDIDETSRESGLRIGDLDGLVARQEHDGLELDRVLLHALLVHDDGLVTGDLIDQGVVRDLGQIAIGLDRHERSVLERRRRERVSLTEFLGVEI